MRFRWRNNCGTMVTNCSASAWIRAISLRSAAKRDACWTRPAFRRRRLSSAATWTRIASNCSCSSGASVDVWGVGTRLVTAHDQPALGGVYKLAALRAASGAWTYKLKVSEQGSKQSDPGILQVRRLRTAAGRFAADVIYDELSGLSEPLRLVPLGADSAQVPPEHAEHEDLLIPVFRAGRPLYAPPERWRSPRPRPGPARRVRRFAAGDSRRPALPRRPGQRIVRIAGPLVRRNRDRSASPRRNAN